VQRLSVIGNFATLIHSHYKKIEIEGV
jgi:hypothetical protein